MLLRVCNVPFAAITILTDIIKIWDIFTDITLKRRYVCICCFKVNINSTENLKYHMGTSLA